MPISALFPDTNLEGYVNSNDSIDETGTWCGGSSEGDISNWAKGTRERFGTGSRNLGGALKDE